MKVLDYYERVIRKNKQKKIFYLAYEVKKQLTGVENEMIHILELIYLLDQYSLLANQEEKQEVKKLKITLYNQLDSHHKNDEIQQMIATL